MYLKTLQIKNFRCFKNYEITFAPGVTVLFGKNGTGKTTLINATFRTLNFIMHSENNEAYKVIDGEKKRVLLARKTITSGNKFLRVKDFKETDYYDAQTQLIEIISKDAKLDDDTPLPKWTISAYTNKLATRPTEYREAFNTFYDWHKRTNQLPLLAYYSDTFPHIEEYTGFKRNTKRNESSAEEIISKERNFGYHRWDEEVGCVNIWFNRLENNKYKIYQLEKSIRNNQENLSLTKEVEQLENENDKIISKLMEFSKSLLSKSGNEAIQINDIFDSNNGLAIRTKNGKEIPFRLLPAGYRRIYSIVLDLAYRSYFLSQGESTALAGVVMIDEIDLHLHPELERVVLQGLTETFPNTQFIVSTHSPLVLSNISTIDGNNSILRMEPLDNMSDDEDYGEEEEDEEEDNIASEEPMRPTPLNYLYGLDIKTVVRDQMGVDSSDDERLAWRIERYKDLMKNEKYSASAKKIKEIILKSISEKDLEERIK